MEWAQTVINHYGGELIRIDFSKLWTFQGFPNIPTADEPMNWTYHSKRIIDKVTMSRGIRLMLNGLGGDDLFDAPPDILFYDQLTWKHPIQTINKLNYRVQNGCQSYIDIYRRAKLNPQKSLMRLPEYLTSLLCIHEKSNLRFQGKNRVHKNVEMRIRSTRPYVEIPSTYIHQSPLFDPRIIEVAASLPLQMLRNNNGTKIALREAAHTLLPELVVNRKKENPHTPILLQGLRREWPVIDHYFRHNVLLYDIGFINRDKFISALQSFRGGNTKLAQHIIYVFACEVWLTKQ